MAGLLGSGRTALARLMFGVDVADAGSAEMAIAGAVAAACVTSGYSVWVAVPSALAIGLLCGLWNGILVTMLDVQPIIATLVLMVAGRGVAQLITKGSTVTLLDDKLIFLGTGALFGFPMPVVIALVLMLAATFVVRRTALDLLIEAVGVNRSAARFAGMSSTILLLIVYTFSGFCAAVAGIIVAADIRGADANNAGLWLELDAILAVVIGGTSLLGGRFSMVMSVVGALIIQAMNTGILASGFRSEFNLIVKAGVIISLILQSPIAAGLFRKRARGAK